MAVDNEEIKKALKIKNAIQNYLEQTKEVNIRSTDIFPYLVRRGLFEPDRHNGLYFRKFLKKLYQANILHSLIPQCKYIPGINEEIFGEWYFNSYRPETVKNKEKTIENNKFLDVNADLSFEDAKENLWQLLEGINPLSGEKINDTKEPSLTLIRTSLKVFIEADINSVKEKNRIENEEIKEEETNTPSPAETEESLRREPPPANYIEEVRKKYPKAYYPWDKEEESLLIRFYNENHKVRVIAEKLERQPGAIKARLKKIGLLD